MIHAVLLFDKNYAWVLKASLLGFMLVGGFYLIILAFKKQTSQEKTYDKNNLPNTGRNSRMTLVCFGLVLMILSMYGISKLS